MMIDAHMGPNGGENAEAYWKRDHHCQSHLPGEGSKIEVNEEKSCGSYLKSHGSWWSPPPLASLKKDSSQRAPAGHHRPRWVEGLRERATSTNHKHQLTATDAGCIITIEPVLGDKQ